MYMIQRQAEEGLTTFLGIRPWNEPFTLASEAFEEIRKISNELSTDENTQHILETDYGMKVTVKEPYWVYFRVVRLQPINR